MNDICQNVQGVNRNLQIISWYIDRSNYNVQQIFYIHIIQKYALTY